MPEQVLRKCFNRNPSNFFVKGNAGDLFVNNILKATYGKDITINNIVDKGNRILLIGSIGHMIKDNDLLCGIGINDIMPPVNSKRKCTILGLRGPLSYEAFKKAGHDVSNINFLMDPGLLLKYFFSSEELSYSGKDIIFIPHYRERYTYKNYDIPNGIKLIDIDCDPINLGRKIINAKPVYTSSLHGIIFAHSLGRPCIFVQPQTKESLIKYVDYYTSINHSLPMPLRHISEAKFTGSPDSPANIKFKKSDFIFPEPEYLRQKLIINN